MERRALLAAVLSMLVFVVWQYFFLPPPPPPEQAPSSVPATGEATAPVVSGAPATPPPSPVSTAVPAEASALPKVQKVLQGKVFEATFTSEGGGLEGWKLKEFTSYRKGEGLFDAVRGAVSGSAQKHGPAGTMDVLEGPFENATPFKLAGVLEENARYRLASETATEVVFEREIGDLLVRKKYQLNPDDYLVKLEVSLHNRGATPLSLTPSFGVKGQYSSGEQGSYAPHPTPIYYVDGDVEFVAQRDPEDPPLIVQGVVGWAGVNDKYFLRALLPPGGAAGTVTITDQPDRVFTTEFSRGVITLAGGTAQTLSYQLFLGPKKSEVLAGPNRDLQKSLDFGTFGVFAEPLLALLKFLHRMANSWGVAIILLTLIIKTLFYPLFVKQLESAQKMKEFQPQMNALKEKYKDDRNQLNQEMMRFMQENKINPLGGCLPMLLQMPIWFALYQVLQNSIELYHQPFLYLPDLSEQDPYGISPAVLGVLMFLQQKMTPPPPGMDPAQAKMMQYLPLIFAGIMFTLPSGLVIYILVNTLLTIAQQWYITRKADKKALLAKAGTATRRP